MELSNCEVWFVTGSQRLYDPETLRQLAANAETVARALHYAAQIPVRVVYKPVLTSPQEICQLCLEATQSHQCLGPRNRQPHQVFGE